jgi:proline dehydrogenase
MLPVVSRFVAGETPAEALERAADLNDRGIGAIVNLLGEHYRERAPADRDATTYRELVDHVANAGLWACVSVKPSQIGLAADEAAFRANAERIVAAAANRGIFVWFDMEDHTTTDATLDAYEALAREYGPDADTGAVGICLQANLRRTAGDLERLAPLPGKVRLVKGAYDEPADIAHRSKAAVNAAYRDHLAYMFREFDDGIAVGSHDPAMIDLARDLHPEHGTSYEVQMLMGVREAAQTGLAADGVEVWQYVPYGARWAAYFSRRAAERRENLAFAVRAILSG